jgi:geranylgeranyl diphosphate synthase type II
MRVSLRRPIMNTTLVRNEPVLPNGTSHRSTDSISHKQAMIEHALDQYTRFGTGCPDKLKEAMRYSLLMAGKRLRPLMTMMAAESCGGSAEAALPAACAVEIIHTYSLIHDDLPSMDNDDTRRGRATSHKVFGEAMAILAGDALLTLAFEVLARDIQPAQVAAACCRVLAEACGPNGLVGGQADDISSTPATGSRELLEAIHNRKTGALFQAALRLGGLTAGANEKQLAALDQFGRKLGLAFQITDDLLDHDVDPRCPSRISRNSDAGKLTFPNLMGVEQSRAEVKRLVHEACAALEPLGNGQRSLGALAHFVLDRT